MNVFKALFVTGLTAVPMVACSGAGGNSSTPDGQNNGQGGQGGQPTYQAVCQITGAQGAVVCVDFPANSAINSTSCTTFEYPSYQAEGAAAYEYQGVGAQSSGAVVTTSCAIFNSATPMGSCTLSDRVVRYYAAAWSATTAQANCSSRNGQWGK